jgi:hypothetical protein
MKFSKQIDNKGTTYNMIFDIFGLLKRILIIEGHIIKNNTKIILASQFQLKLKKLQYVLIKNTKHP